MAKFDNLKEVFSSALNTSIWSTYAGTPTVSVGRLFATIAAGLTVYHGIRSVEYFDLTSSSVSVELFSAGNQALASFEVYPVWVAPDDDNGVFFIVNSNTTYCYTRIATVNTSVFSTAYSTTDHRYFRIKEDNGSILWQVSSDNMSWTTLHSVLASTLFAVTAMRLIILAGTYAVEASDAEASFDNVNLTRKSSFSTFEREISPYPFSPRRVR